MIDMWLSFVFHSVCYYLYVKLQAAAVPVEYILLFFEVTFSIQ